MNKIRELFSSMNDDELVNAIAEIKQSEETGLVGDIVREMSRRTGEITGGFTATDFLMTQINILKEAAYRWCPNNEKK